MAYAFVVTGPSSVIVGGITHLVYQIAETDVVADSEWTIPGLPAVYTISTYETSIEDAGATGAGARVAPAVGYVAAFTTAALSLIKQISDVAQTQIRRELARKVARIGGGALYGRSRPTNDGAVLGVPIPSILTRLTIVAGHLQGDDPPPPTDPDTFAVTAQRVFAAAAVDTTEVVAGCHSVVEFVLQVTDITGITSVTFSVKADDGKLIADDSIESGAFDANNWTGTIDGANLAVGSYTIRVPQPGGRVKLAVNANAASGGYNVRARRLA